MFGVPSGVAFDPSGVTNADGWATETGYLLSALDIALARPSLRPAPTSRGSVEEIWVSPAAGAPAQGLEAARALAGRGLDGDRHVTGKGTFPSGLPGSALTLIEAEVCESFTPPLGADEHRRNVVTRGIELNDLVGHDFMLGQLPCRGMRLCEPCTVVDGYAGRPILRALVHRGGLRADILEDGELRLGDPGAASLNASALLRVDGPLQLALVHPRAALDLESLGLVVELVAGAALAALGARAPAAAPARGHVAG